MKSWFYLTLSLCFIFSVKVFSQQATNQDPSKSFVNINMPKTPESAGFEKYGYAQVNEFTGTTSLSIPIYTLKSRFLEVPITLDYQARGVKVNQEASWVGLGFDLNAGGRITVETRGAVDFCNSTYGVMTPNTQTALDQIFTRLGTSGENAILTPATFSEPNFGGPIDPNVYNGNGIAEMTLYGTGEPDIFRANFNGQSITYYIDRVSNTAKFLGNRSNCSISYTLDSYHNITSWTILDNDGISYKFDQQEISTNTFASNAVTPASSTTAWLLTKITHPSGDYIQFTYTNYGYSVPAYAMNGLVDVQTVGGTIPPNDYQQNINVQSPYYLTRAESADIAVDFVLDTRTDLYGPGSRKLSQVRVTDKQANTIKRTATFNYSYFTATLNTPLHNYLNGLSYNLPSGLSASAYIATSTGRLKLDSVNLFDNSLQPPYKFYYNTNLGVPDKYSYGQDHWGYYNGVNNSVNGYTFSHLVPFGGQFGVQNQLPPAGFGFSTSTIGTNRECDSAYSLTMMMDSIIYPTGGSTRFFYEPHKTNMINGTGITGGGIRVKTIKNYAGGILTGTREYTYTYGKYMGAISYMTTSAPLPYCVDGDLVGHWKYSSNGAVNADEILIGYGTIRIQEKDRSGIANGATVKTFNINTASSNYATGTGFDIQEPYIFPPETPVTADGKDFTTWLDATHKNLPPTPSSNLEGKLIQEQYFDNTDNCLKAIRYYYSLGNYTNNFYDVKAIQNRTGGFTGNCGSNSPCAGINWGGVRPVNIFVSPAKSFYLLTDSIKEVTYNGSDSLVVKKTFTYDSKFQTKSESVYASDNTITTTSYTRPYEYLQTGVNGSTTIVYEMVGRNMNNALYSTARRKNGSLIDSVFNLYYNPSSGVDVPQNTQIQVGSNPIEIRQTYNNYDSYGHLLEKQKPGGTREIYLWGYNSKFPVAHIIGSDYATVSGIVSASVLNAPASDAVLRNELNKLRLQLGAALVTTYTYDPVFGITSETDPKGITVYYEYDAMGRLAVIRDQDKNVLKRLCYNYAGQPESCQYFYNDQQSNTYVRSNCSPGYAGTAATYTVPANTYGSAISKADANAKALADVNQNGQAYADSAAACVAACSFSMMPGYSTPTNSISSDGDSATFYITFYSTTTDMQVTTSYTVAQIVGGCTPLNSQTMDYTTGGRTWRITISGSYMSFKIMAGAVLPKNTTVTILSQRYSVK